MRSTVVSKFLKKKTSFYLFIISGTGASALTYYSTLNPNRNRHSLLDVITTSFNGVLRSSRSLYTITANVVDYKYSLQGLLKDTDEYAQVLSEVHLRSAKRILKLCEVNQGFYIKAGQFVASVRQVPKEYSSTLASLQDQAVPCSFEAVKEVLISNLGSDLNEIFISIDEQPIAAASIAQVHRALLKDHQEVVLKIQYPGLKNRMKMDIATMSLLAKCVTWFFPEYRFQWMVSEFSKVIALELDFLQEARNSVTTAVNFKHNNRIRVPKVFQELTTSQVLTMEYCRGRRVDDLDYIREMGIDPRKVAKVLVEAFAEMIFVHGFVHGDPHPGNILVSLDEKQGFRLVLLDHGIYKTLDEEFRVNYCQLWKALVLLDSHKIQQVAQHFGIGKYAKYLSLIFTGRTINSRSAFGEGMSVEEKTNLKQEVKSLSMGDVSEFMESLPSEFLTVLRTDALVRSLTSKLGSSQRERLVVYANYALHGLSLKPDSDSGNYFVSKGVRTRIMSRIGHLQVRLVLELLQLLWWLRDTRQALITWSKQITRLVDHHHTPISVIS
ncbi:putative ABC-type Cd(2+) transporter, protein kinase Group-Pl-3 family [Helianthus annuus]|nr:putative ABC-type Cd(2+) transporter, protein kinase Group-Pl-3 family [Helianthus annuus]